MFRCVNNSIWDLYDFYFFNLKYIQTVPLSVFIPGDIPCNGSPFLGTFLSGLAEPWELSRKQPCCFPWTWGTPVAASSSPWLFPETGAAVAKFLGRRWGLPPLLILPSTCGALFPGMSQGRDGQLAWTVDDAGLQGPERKTQNRLRAFICQCPLVLCHGPLSMDFYWKAVSGRQQLLSQ